MGSDNDSGSAVSGANGFDGVAEGVASGVDVGAGAAGAGVDFAGAVVVVVAGAVVGVVSFGDAGRTLDVAAPAGPRPASTPAPPRTRTPLNTAIE
jgi:hypothetical protein